MNTEILELCDRMAEAINQLPLEEKVEALNQVRSRLHQVSPFNAEPVDCVLWVKSDKVQANSYNPNSVVSPEMKLLQESVEKNGFSFPVITFPLPLPDGEEVPPISDDSQEIVDGFHRSSIGRTVKKIAKRMHGYLPVAQLKGNRSDLHHRMAATIQFNRARGKHQTELMAGIVAQMKAMGQTDIQIAKALGMDGEEVLRLKQLTGLADLFANQEFSKAWVSYQEGDGTELAKIVPE